jgi:hypothetical protein
MNISIRKAIHKDIDWLVQELQEFSAFHGAKIPMFGEEEYVRKTLADYIDQHFFRIADTEEFGQIGFIAAFVTPHFMNPLNRIMSEIFWWVPEIHRGSRAGSKLLLEFISWGKANVDTIYMALESHSPVKPETLVKLGFRPHEQSFIMEVNQWPRA